MTMIGDVISNIWEFLKPLFDQLGPVIEDMFSRLNDGVLLNAAEKRNALGGITVFKL